jgi:hypothetical protein
VSVVEPTVREVPVSEVSEIASLSEEHPTNGEAASDVLDVPPPEISGEADNRDARA